MKMVNDSSPSPELKLLPDDCLMTSVKNGHPDALAVLFDRYRRLVLNIAWRILRDRGEAEDLVQSVFLEIFQSAAKFDSAKGTTKSWILQYAYHRSFNRRQYLYLRGITNSPNSFRLADETPSPSRTWSFERVESERFVQEALEQLNGKQRKILELAFYEGLSMREAAEVTGESFDTVRHHYYRGIGNLRSMIYKNEMGHLTKCDREEGPSLAGSLPPVVRRALSKAKEANRVPIRRFRAYHNRSDAGQKALLVRA